MSTGSTRQPWNNADYFITEGSSCADQNRAGLRRADAHPRGGRDRPQARHGTESIGRLCGRAARQTVAVLGLTFKPNIDAMCEARSIPRITALQDMGAKVRAYDPVGLEQVTGGM
jgi:hypothetical protein